MTELDRLRTLEGAKWTRYGPDVLPAWVADMDFDQAPAIKRAIVALVERGDLGYNFTGIDGLVPAWLEWVRSRHDMVVPAEEVWKFTGALHGLEVAMTMYTEPGDGVVVFTPIYHPFPNAIRDSGRTIVDVPLTEDGWRLDADRFADAIDDRTKVVLFSQPHNPIGRVFSAEEIQAFADVVIANDLLVISDEVWADVTYEPHRHIPLVVGDPRLLDHTLTLGSASKAFNVSGLRCALGHVGSEFIRTRLDTLPTHIPGGPSTISGAATLAAWTECDDWLAKTMSQLTINRDHVAERLAAEAPQVGFNPPEATYLGWLDCRATTLGDDPSKTLLDHAGVALDQGSKFGAQGLGHARLNFATTEDILDTILDRIVEAVQKGVTP